MVHAHHGDAPAQGQGFGGGDADEQGADQTRSGRDGHGAQVLSGHPGLLQGSVDDGRHGFEVGAAGQFRDDAAERGVEIDLAGHEGRADRERLVDHGRRCLVTRGLDGQQGSAHRASQGVGDGGPCQSRLRARRTARAR